MFSHSAMHSMRLCDAHGDASTYDTCTNNVCALYVLSVCGWLLVTLLLVLIIWLFTHLFRTAWRRTQCWLRWLINLAASASAERPAQDRMWACSGVLVAYYILLIGPHCIKCWWLAYDDTTSILHKIFSTNEVVGCCLDVCCLLAR